jgi:hypothetical protein
MQSGVEPDHLLLSKAPSFRSDLHVDVEDVFEAPLAATGDVLVVEEDDSVTESDDDVPNLPRVIEPSQQSPPGQEGYSIQSVLDPDDGSGTTAGSSSGSLPSVVRDFYDMFGGEDGSYPDDFPQSLKWTGAETQD